MLLHGIKDQARDDHRILPKEHEFVRGLAVSLLGVDILRRVRDERHISWDEHELLKQLKLGMARTRS